MSFNLWTIIIAQRARKEIGNLHHNKKKPNKICINEIQCHNIGPFLDNPRSSCITSTPTPSLSGFSCLVGNLIYFGVLINELVQFEFDNVGRRYTNKR
jgi:hypothetical protein